MVQESQDCKTETRWRQDAGVHTPVMARKPKPFLPDWASPPGDTIQDCLDERGMTKLHLMRALGIPFDFAHELLLGEKCIVQEIAEGLEKMFDVPAQFWMNLERQYREAQLRLAKNRR